MSSERLLVWNLTDTMNIRTVVKTVKAIVHSLLLLGMLSACHSAPDNPPSLTHHVDPFSQANTDCHLFIGASTPGGSIHTGPVQRLCKQKACSGYHCNDSIIIGFGHRLYGASTHPEGFTIFPSTDHRKEYLFSREFEVAKPGYYSVWIPEADIAIELTATTHTSLHRYFFPRTMQAQLTLSVIQRYAPDNTEETHFVQESNTVISGHYYTSEEGRNLKVYFTTLFSQPIRSIKFSDNTQESSANLFFDTTQQEDVRVRTALSLHSIKEAKEYLKAEHSGWSFQQVNQQATQAWNEELRKAEIPEEEKKDTKRFYTALFQSITASSFSDESNVETGRNNTKSAQTGK